MMQLSPLDASGWPKLLILDSDVEAPATLLNAVQQSGYQARWVNSLPEAKAQIQSWLPRFVIGDAAQNGLELLEWIQSVPHLAFPFTTFFLSSATNDDTLSKSCFQLGGKDFLIKPLPAPGLIDRLSFHSRKYRLSAFSERNGSDPTVHSDRLMMDFLTATNDPELAAKPETLTLLLHRLKVFFQGGRCSIIEIMDPQTGRLLASSDPFDQEQTIELKKYPEYKNVALSKTPFAIEDLDLSKTLRTIKEKVGGDAVQGLLVSYVPLEGVQGAVLAMRKPPEASAISDHEIRVFEMAAKCLGLFLKQLPKKS